MEINDRRTDKTRPKGYVVFTDKFMSGWGCAPGTSYYALAFNDYEEANILLENGSRRSEMKRGRIVTTLRKDGTPRVRGTDRDHLSVTDRTDASRWYERGGF